MTTVTSLAPAVATATPAELRAAARDHYRHALSEGTAPSGAELGRRFGMSERWGRDRATEVNTSPAAGTASPTPTAAGMPGNGAGMPGNGAGMPRNGAGTAEPVGGTPNGSTATVPDEAGHAGPVDGMPAGTGPAEQGVRAVIRWVTTAAVIVVAACAARASYDHQRHVVEMAGEDQAAWYLPLSVDGMMLVASLNMLVRRWDHQPAGRLTWCALTLGGMASLAANVAAAEPTLVGRLVAAWPPICLIVSYELLMQQLPTRGGERHHPTGP